MRILDDGQFTGNLVVEDALENVRCPMLRHQRAQEIEQRFRMVRHPFASDTAFILDEWSVLGALTLSLTAYVSL